MLSAEFFEVCSKGFGTHGLGEQEFGVFIKGQIFVCGVRHSDR